MQKKTKAAQKISRSNSSTWIKQDKQRLKLFSQANTEKTHFPQKSTNPVMNQVLLKTVAGTEQEKGESEIHCAEKSLGSAMNQELPKTVTETDRENDVPEMQVLKLPNILETLIVKGN